MIKRTVSRLTSKKSISDCYDVVVHIGAPKTGSSAIQRFCVENRKYLESVGFYYPEHPLDKNGVSGGHTEIAGALINDKYLIAEERFNNYLKLAKKNKATLLLSAEAFYGQYQNIAYLCKGLSVRVIGFLRHPVDYLLGNHNQGIKRHMETHRLNESITRMLSKPTPHLVGQPFVNWADQFGDENCYFAAYQAPGSGLSLEAIFLKAIGVSDDEATRKTDNVIVTNRSYVKSALELKRLLNTVLPNLPDDFANRVDWCLQGYSDNSANEQPYQKADIPEILWQRLSNHLSEQIDEVKLRFPLLKEVATIDDPLDRHKNIDTGFSLQFPFSVFAKELPDVLIAVQKEALNQHTEGRRDYVFLKLMDVLGLDFYESNFPKSVVDADALKRLTRPKNTAPDYLRETALMLERLGYFVDALKVIDMAVELRPNGKALLLIKDRLTHKISS